MLSPSTCRSRSRDGAVPSVFPDPRTAEPVGAHGALAVVRRRAAAHRRPRRHIGDRDELRFGQVLGVAEGPRRADAMQQPVAIDLQDLGNPVEPSGSGRVERARRMS